LFRQLKKFAANEGLVYVSDFTIDYVRRFRASWTNKNFAAKKKLEYTKTFLEFCKDSQWITNNPADPLKPASTTPPVIVPITNKEFGKILKACDSYPNRTNAIRLKALVLVMRFTGLRIRDVITLRKEHIQNGRLFLRTAKTKTDVFCPVPPAVIKALDRIEALGPFFFWNGRSKVESVVSDYQRALRLLFKLAETPRVHAHLFRHTFATGLLADGNSLETVATLLGHSNTSVTKKNYDHWVQGRQDKLEAAVKNPWAQLGTIADSQPKK
jgi:integrase/recombinase XerD